MERSKKNFKNQLGQSSVEYILLLAVVVSLMTAVMRSDAFQGALGEESQIFASLYQQMSFSYRHPDSGTLDTTLPPPARDLTHASFRSSDGTSRIVIPTLGYP